MKNLRHPKISLFCFLAPICVCLAWLLLTEPPLPPVRVSLLYTGRDLNLSRIGVFRLENYLKEPVRVTGAIFEKTTWHGWVHAIGDVSADLGGNRKIASGESALFQIRLPKAEGYYRLILHCLPDSQANALSRSRLRIARSMSWLPSRIQGWLLGIRFAASQPIRLTGSDKVRPPSPPVDDRRIRLAVI